MFTKKVKGEYPGGERQQYLFQVVLKGHFLDDWTLDTRWHSIKKGEIFHTDGIERKEKWCGDSKGYCIY
jgi:hypothetical protein